MFLARNIFLTAYRNKTLFSIKKSIEFKNQIQTNLKKQFFHRNTGPSRPTNSSAQNEASPLQQLNNSNNNSGNIKFLLKATIFTALVSQNQTKNLF
jgi:hypothetical protein